MWNERRGKDKPVKSKSPDRAAFYAAILFITIPMVLFFVFVCPHLVAELGAIVVIIPVYAVVVCLTALLITNNIDPGVIPRGNSLPPPEEEPKVALVIRGKSLSVRYCTTCRIIRPPRASHCSDCDRCVEKFDHHCPWVGNCIGKRNYRFFVMFLGTCTFLCAYVCGFSIVRIVWSSRDQSNILDAVLESPVSLILIIYSFFIFWSVAGLFVYHQYLIGIALTTHEEMKSTFSSGSPFSGGIVFNFVSVWCSPCYQSYIPKNVDIITNRNFAEGRHHHEEENEIETEEEEEVEAEIEAEPLTGGAYRRDDDIV